MAAVKKRASAANKDYLVKDIGLAEYGRKEIELAENEMPGLMAIREEYGRKQPLKGARIAGSLHMTIQTAVLIETLQALGAEVRWASCNIFSTQDHAAAAIAARGTPGVRLEGRVARRVLGLHRPQVFDWGDGERPEHDPGRRRRRDAVRAPGRTRPRRNPSILDTKPGSEEERILLARSRSPEERPELIKHARPISRRLRGDDHRRASPLPDAQGRPLAVPRDQRQRLGHQVEVRQPLRLPRIAGRRHQARDRRDVRRQGRGRRRLRRRRQGLGRSRCARQARRVIVTEIDPICALQAAMEGYQVTTMDEAVRHGDIFVTATGCVDVITGKHMQADEAQRHRLQHRPLRQRDRQVACAQASTSGPTSSRRSTTCIFPDGKRIIVLAEGRLVNLGCATGHPWFVMSNIFTNQVLAQIELCTNTDKYHDRRLRAAEAPRREGRAAAPREARREADRS